MPLNAQSSIPNDASILLVGHGTRDERGQAELLQTAAMLRKRLPGVPVEACFLELASPDVATAVLKLAGSGGTRQIVVVPVLLFAAGHAKEDIPRAVVDALKKCGTGRSGGLPHGVKLHWAEALDCHPQIVELSARRFREACIRGQCEEVRSEERMLILVGRGTSDAEAVARVYEFAAQRAAATPVGHHIVCFLAAASPTFEEALGEVREQALGAAPSKHVIVQPHLLFHGQLAEEIRVRVEQLASQSVAGGLRWHFAEHLGPQPELIKALVDRIFAAFPACGSG